MLFATFGQAPRFIWMAAAGAAIGAWYALTALLRRILCAGFWLTLVCDLLFGAGAALIFIAASVAGSYGSVRLFEIAAACLGAVLFALVTSPPIKSAGNALRRAAAKISTYRTKNRRINVIFK